MNHQGRAHLYHSLAPGQPKHDTLQPLLHPCSSFSQEQIRFTVLPGVLGVTAHSLEAAVQPTQFSLPSLAFQTGSKPTPGHPGPARYLHLPGNQWDFRDLKGRNPDRCSYHLSLSTSTPSQSLWMVPSEQDTPERRATIQKYFNKLEDLSTRRCRKFNKGKCTQSLGEKNPSSSLSRLYCMQNI